MSYYAVPPYAERPQFHRNSGAQLPTGFVARQSRKSAEVNDAAGHLTTCKPQSADTKSVVPTIHAALVQRGRAGG